MWIIHRLVKEAINLSKRKIRHSLHPDIQTANESVLEEPANDSEVVWLRNVSLEYQVTLHGQFTVKT